MTLGFPRVIPFEILLFLDVSGLNLTGSERDERADPASVGRDNSD
jgi:hypothetical protein